MILLGLLSDVIENNHLSPLMADWIEEFRSYQPEANVYIEKLRSKNITLLLLIEAVATFGDKEERKLIRKLVKKTLQEGRGNKAQKRRMKFNDLVITERFKKNLMR